MAKGFFITGTDTDVGKTVIAAAIVRALHISGYNVAAMKPVETGCSRVGDVLVPRDGTFLKDIARMKDPINQVSPLCFSAPVAPMIAAEIENEEINVERLLGGFHALSLKYDAVVVEGVGGLLVPLKRNYYVSDLAGDMGLPLIVVASPFLGTINHTLLTVEHAVNCGLSVAGVVINYFRPPEGSLAEETNPRVLARLLSVPVIGIMPYIRDLDAQAIDRAVSKAIDIKVLKKHI